MLPYSDFSPSGTKIKSYQSFDREMEQQSNNKRAEFYLEYYKNLSPSEFEVSLYGDSILIKVPGQSV